jgi:hypothetical protein
MQDIAGRSLLRLRRERWTAFGNTHPMAALRLRRTTLRYTCRRCQSVRLLSQARRRPPLRGPLFTQIPALNVGVFAPLPFFVSAETRVS